jgi:hypothetical protein
MPTACMHVLGKLPAKNTPEKCDERALCGSAVPRTATQQPRCRVPVAHSMTIMHRLPETAVHISTCGAAVHHCVHSVHAAICRSVFTGAERCFQLVHLGCTSSGTEALQTNGPAISWRVHQWSLTSVSLCAPVLCAMDCSTPFSTRGGLLSPIFTAARQYELLSPSLVL